jgi:hypothetical protein
VLTTLDARAASEELDDQVERRRAVPAALVTAVDHELPEVMRDVSGHIVDLVADHHEAHRRPAGVDRPLDGTARRFLDRLLHRLRNGAHESPLPRRKLERPTPPPGSGL